VGSADEVQYLDEPQCDPFWAKLAQLDVPLYLHPRIPPPDQIRVFKGYEFLAGSPWGFGRETAEHSLRLMVSGLFDRYPNLQIVLGHCGEGLPFSIARTDHRLRHFRKGLHGPHQYPPMPLLCQEPLDHFGWCPEAEHIGGYNSRGRH
jgi:predicted TIM-barrel fold metal-dependent hydrolase